MIKSVWRVGIALLMLIVGAHTSVNLPLPGSLEPIPVTGQSLAVIVASVLLPRKQGVVVMVLYLLLGSLGLPVFAGGESGYHHLIGKTSGYLFSFILIPVIFGSTKRMAWSGSLMKAFLANALSTLTILCLGTLVLSTFIGIQSAIQYGFYPFIMPGLLKSIIGAVLIRGLISLEQRSV